MGNCQQILPTTHSTRAIVDREDLLKATHLSALIASSSANVVKLTVSADGAGSVAVSANAEIGDNEGDIEAEVEGEGTTIAFNARFLAEVLQNLDAAQLAIEFNGPLSPGVLRPIGDVDYVHVIMPVRTAS